MTSYRKSGLKLLPTGWKMSKNSPAGIPAGPKMKKF
jgi:hypothetical protein